MKKRRLILLVWVFITGLLLAMTTYAWFTTNRIFEIESFDIQIATKGGLQISTDAIDWKGVVGMADFMAAVNTYPANKNQIPNMVLPVSTAGEVENGLLKMFYGTVNVRKHFYLTTFRETEKAALMNDSDGKYVSFDIFVKSTSPKKLQIVPDSGVSYKTDVSQPTGIENAFRIGFINKGNLSSSSNINLIQNLNNGNESIVWEPNYDTHTLAAIDHAKTIYNIITTENNANIIPYYGVANEIPAELELNVSKANSADYPQYFKLVKPNITTIKNDENYHYFTDIAPGITKLRVYIWVEGQDIDCENSASQGSLIINLQFVAK